MSRLQALQQWGELLYDVPLATRTTLGVGGSARYLFRPHNVQNLQQAMVEIPADTKRLILGRGSNLLIGDDGFDGLVIDSGALQYSHQQGNRLTVGAGMRQSKVAQLAAQAGLCGAEFMATIPGDVGGGVAMNAGAFGQQWSDCLHCVQLVLANGQLVEYRGEQLRLRYRHAELPKHAVVVSASLQLVSGDGESIRQRMREMRQQRSASQPLQQPNCGSVFKNPKDDHAARLIEAVGLKGHRIGQAQISPAHANFIVNHGQASAQQVIELIRLARANVEEMFAISLEPEVRMIGVKL